MDFPFMKKANQRQGEFVCMVSIVLRMRMSPYALRLGDCRIMIVIIAQVGTSLSTDACYTQRERKSNLS